MLMVQKLFCNQERFETRCAPTAHISRQFQIGDIPELGFLDGKHDKNTCVHAKRSKQFFLDRRKVRLSQLPDVHLDLVTEPAHAVPLSA